MKTAAERFPFRDDHRPLLKIWYNLAGRLAAIHDGDLTRSPLNGLGELAGPRQWEDNGPTAYKAFLVYFLPIDYKLVNHHLSVLFGVGGSVEISGGNNRGQRISLARRSYTQDPEAFETDLTQAATFVGLLSPTEATPA